LNQGFTKKGKTVLGVVTALTGNTKEKKLPPECRPGGPRRGTGGRGGKKQVLHVNPLMDQGSFPNRHHTGRWNWWVIVKVGQKKKTGAQKRAPGHERKLSKMNREN